MDFSHRRPELRFPRVICDHAAAAKLVADYFLVHGLTRFMFYSAAENWSFDEVGKAFAQTLKKSGHDCNWIRWHQSPVFTTGHLQGKDKRRSLATQLKNAPKPLALFAATDDHALEIIEVCEEIGLAVPEEVSVIGMDNSLPAVEAMHTPISSVDRNLETLGYRRRGITGPFEARAAAAAGSHPHSDRRVDHAQEQRFARGQSSRRCALLALSLAELS